MEEATHTSRAALRPVIAAVVKISAALDCEAVSLLGSVVMRQFNAADHSVNARVVPQRGFGVAAGFWVLQAVGPRGTAASTLSAAHPDSVAEPLLNMGKVVVRRQNTSRARVQVVKPLVGDLSVVYKSSILVTCCQAPLERSVSSRRLRRARSVSRESCAWSCGSLRRCLHVGRRSLGVRGMRWSDL